MRTTARAPTALAKRWTVRMDGEPLPLSDHAQREGAFVVEHFMDAVRLTDHGFQIFH